MYVHVYNYVHNVYTCIYIVYILNVFLFLVYIYKKV